MSELTTNSLLKWLLLISISALLLYFGALLFIPMLFGLLIAFVLYPFCRWMEMNRIPKYLAITACLGVVMILFFALIYILGWQIQLFREEIPEISKKLKIALTEMQEWLQQNWNLATKMQDEWLHSLLSNSGTRITDIVNSIFSATANTLFMLFLVPVYTVLFLYHRSVFVKVFILALGSENEEKLRSVLQEVIFTYANFIKGMIFVYIIVGILNSIGLGILGIKHAILFGMLTAIMTIIPYIGIFLSSLLPICVAFVTKDSIWYPLGVIVVFSFVQYLEANVIFPKVVGKQLELSTWATLVAVIVGGMIWGISGMILFVPIIAILKIVAQNIPEWEPLYVLLNRRE